MSNPTPLSLSHYLSALEPFHPRTNFVPRIIGLSLFEFQGRCGVSNPAPTVQQATTTSPTKETVNDSSNDTVILRVDTPSDMNYSIHFLKENCLNYDNILSSASLWNSLWSHQSSSPRIVIAALPHHYVPALTRTLLHHGRAVTFTEPCRTFAVDPQRWIELCDELRIDNISTGNNGSPSSTELLEQSTVSLSTVSTVSTDPSIDHTEGKAIAKLLGLPDGFCLGTLVPEDAELVDKTWKYTAPGTVDVIRSSIRTRPTACLRIPVMNELTQTYEYKLISWVLIRHDGSMGVLHTLADYRGKGYAKAVIRYAMLVLYRYSQSIRPSVSSSVSSSLHELAPKMAPFCHIKIGNTASEELFLSLGFKPVNYCTWLISNRLAPRFALRPLNVHKTKEWNDMLTMINTSYKEDDAFFVDQTRTDMVNLETMAKEGIFYVGYEWEITSENQEESLVYDGVQDKAYPYAIDNNYSVGEQYPELLDSLNRPRETDNLICLVYLKFDDGGTACPFRVLESSTASTISASSSSSVSSASTETVLFPSSSTTKFSDSVPPSGQRTAHISMLTINSKYKKMGVGQRVLNFALLTSSSTYQCRTMEALVVSVKPWLQDWYRKNGFERIGQEPWPKEIEYQLLKPCHFEIFQKPLDRPE